MPTWLLSNTTPPNSPRRPAARTLESSVAKFAAAQNPPFLPLKILLLIPPT